MHMVNRDDLTLNPPEDDYVLMGTEEPAYAALLADKRAHRGVTFYVVRSDHTGRWARTSHIWVPADLARKYRKLADIAADAAFDFRDPWGHHVVR